MYKSKKESYKSCFPLKIVENALNLSSCLKTFSGYLHLYFSTVRFAVNIKENHGKPSPLYWLQKRRKAKKSHKNLSLFLKWWKIY